MSNRMCHDGAKSNTQGAQFGKWIFALGQSLNKSSIGFDFS